MSNKTCCIVPLEEEGKPYVFEGMKHLKTGCQFSDYLEPKYSYNDNNYCILHLPFKIKKERDLFDQAQVAFYEALKRGETNFSLISTSSIKILADNKIDFLTFTGSYLSSLDIEPRQQKKKEKLEIGQLSFTHAKLEGRINLKNCNIDMLYITNSILSGDLAVSSCAINNFLSWDCKFDNGSQFIRQDGGVGQVIFPDTTIKLFRFNRNICKIQIRFDNSDIENMELESDFYLCPSFSNTDMRKNAKKLMLPRKENIIYDPYFLQYKKKPDDVRIDLIKLIKAIWKSIGIDFKSIHKSKFIENSYAFLKKYTNFYELCCRLREVFGGEKMQVVASMEYHKLREIYDIAKARSMHKAQGDYFYWMQYCLEKSGHLNCITSLASRFYRWTSNYGQSIERPVFGLVVTLCASAVFYHLMGLNLCLVSKPAFLMSIQQIIKPFNLIFYDGSCGFMVYLISFIQSILSIYFLTVLVISLRWNFIKS